MFRRTAVLFEEYNVDPARLGAVTGDADFFIDLDYFKVVNDTYGHPVGDPVLVDLARRLGQAVRREDTVTGFGGDEFIVLCDPVITNDAVYAAHKQAELRGRRPKESKFDRLKLADVAQTKLCEVQP